MTPKVVIHLANLSNPQGCFVWLFKLYRELCPPDAPGDAFYLQPSHKPTPTCWYYKIPLGHTQLSSTVSRLCKLAGIEGYYTNHSLLATVTSRFYQSGVDKQLVMEHTGHQTIEGVHPYKRTSDQQREALSDLLNHECPAGPSTAIIPEQLPRDQPILNQNSLSSSHTQTSQLRSALNLLLATFTSCTLGLPQIWRESEEL